MEEIPPVNPNGSFYEKLLRVANEKMAATPLCERCGLFPPAKIPLFTAYVAVCNNCDDEIMAEYAHLFEDCGPYYCAGCLQVIEDDDIILCQECRKV